MQSVFQKLISLDFWTSLAFWTFIVAVLTFIVAVLAWRATVRFGSEQLRLARAEAERHPILEVSAMSLTEAKEVAEVLDTLKERREWLDEIEEYELSEEEGRNSGQWGIPAAVDPRAVRLWNDDLLIAQQDYDGPIPGKVLRITLMNKGKTAALDVSGQLYLDAHHLQPLYFPGLDAEVEHQGGNVYKVDLSTGTGSKLLPAPTDERLTFNIAVLSKNPGTTQIKYAFATPQGDNVEDVWTLRVPEQ